MDSVVADSAGGSVVVGSMMKADLGRKDMQRH
jgi:hypothetical protein